jgi:Uma2 family endonuclease
MGSNTAKHRRRRPITGEELDAMGDIAPCELVRGRIVWASPSGPEHGIVVVNFAREIGAFVEARGLGKVMGGEVGITTRRGPDTVRGGDVVFMSAERFARWKREGRRGFLDIAPELVVEVFTRSPGAKKLGEKLREYFSIGVKRVWVVNIARRTIRVHRSPEEYRVFGTRDVLEDDEILPGFRADVRRLVEGS